MNDITMINIKAGTKIPHDKEHVLLYHENEGCYYPVSLSDILSRSDEKASAIEASEKTFQREMSAKMRSLEAKMESFKREMESKYSSFLSSYAKNNEKIIALVEESISK